MLTKKYIIFLNEVPSTISAEAQAMATEEMEARANEVQENEPKYTGLKAWLDNTRNKIESGQWQLPGFISGAIIAFINFFVPEKQNSERVDGQQMENTNQTLISNIFENQEVNIYLTEMAIQAGYRPKINSFEEAGRIEESLQSYGEHRLQADTYDNFTNLKSELEDLGYQIEIGSAFRSIEDQKEIFLNHLAKIPNFNIDKTEEILNGKFDTEIAKILETSSIPGYSYHHLGNTIDFYDPTSQPVDGSVLLAFENSKTGQFLQTQEGKKILEKHNFQPNYPNDGVDRGPIPEPWEFRYEDS